MSSEVQHIEDNVPQSPTTEDALTGNDVPAKSQEVNSVIERLVDVKEEVVNGDSVGHGHNADVLSTTDESANNGDGNLSKANDASAQDDSTMHIEDMPAVPASVTNHGANLDTALQEDGAHTPAEVTPSTEVLDNPPVESAVEEPKSENSLDIFEDDVPGISVEGPTPSDDSSSNMFADSGDDEDEGVGNSHSGVLESALAAYPDASSDNHTSTEDVSTPVDREGTASALGGDELSESHAEPTTPRLTQTTVPDEKDVVVDNHSIEQATIEAEPHKVPSELGAPLVEESSESPNALSAEKSVVPESCAETFAPELATSTLTDAPASETPEATETRDEPAGDAHTEELASDTPAAEPSTQVSEAPVIETPSNVESLEVTETRVDAITPEELSDEAPAVESTSDTKSYTDEHPAIQSDEPVPEVHAEEPSVQTEEVAPAFKAQPKEDEADSSTLTNTTTTDSSITDADISKIDEGEDVDKAIAPEATDFAAPRSVFPTDQSVAAPHLDSMAAEDSTTNNGILSHIEKPQDAFSETKEEVPEVAVPSPATDDVTAVGVEDISAETAPFVAETGAPREEQEATEPTVPEAHTEISASQGDHHEIDIPEEHQSALVDTPADPSEDPTNPAITLPAEEVPETEPKLVDEHQDSIEADVAAIASTEVDETETTSAEALDVKVDTPTLTVEDNEPISDDEQLAEHSSLEIDTSGIEVQQSNVESLGAENGEPERPTSPWTPSYSVTSQGPGLPAEEDTANVEQQPPAVSAEISAKETPQDSIADVLPVDAKPPVNLVVESEVAGDVSELALKASIPESESPAAKLADNEEDTFDAVAEDTETPATLVAPTLSLDTQEQYVQDTAIEIDTSVVEVNKPQPELFVAAEQEIERPKSPWTPSYSVSKQGPGLSGDEDVPSAELPSGDSAFVAESQGPSSEALDASTESHEQDTSSPIVHNEISTLDAGPQPVHEDILAFEFSPTREEHNHDAVIGHEEESSLSASTSDTEPLKSPWSPSYTVTTQGPAEPLAEEELEELEQLPPANDSAVPISVSGPGGEGLTGSEEPDLGESISSLAEPSAEVSIPTFAIDGPGRTSFVDDPSIAEAASLSPMEDAASELPGAEENGPALADGERDPPKSPWTPSYSVVSQGSPNLPHEDASEIADLEQLPPPEVTVKGFSAEPVDASAEKEPAARTVEAYDGNVQPLEESPLPKLSVDITPSASDSIEEARPKSPWTPSYSVNRQGSPFIGTQDLEATDGNAEVSIAAEDQAGPVVESDVPDESPAHDTTGSSFAAAEDPSTLAKDVSSFKDDSTAITEDPVPSAPQAESPAVQEEPAALADSSITATEEAALSENTDESESFAFSKDGLSETSPEESISPLAPLEIPQDQSQPERPKSPWTPSYSVTRQGPELSDADSTLDKESAKDIPPRSGAPSPESLEHSTANDNETPAVAQDLDHVPELADTVSDTLSRKPTLSRLNTVEANNDSEETPTAIDASALDTGRTRVNSTTSSRWFPGGWFSSSPKLPDEGRASLDYAAGEFASPLVSSEGTPLKSPMLNPTTPNDEEKKSRWCTIM